MLDEYLWCQVSRISPEAPVPVCAVSSTTHVLGGAANVAANILALGSVPILVGVVGDDQGAEKLLKLAESKKINTSGLLTVVKRPTSVKTRIVAHHQHVVRVDHETCEEIAMADQNRVFDAVKSEIGTAKALVLSDYSKGVLTGELTQRLIKLAVENKVPVLVDPKGDDPHKYKGATTMTPNFSEFQIFAKTKFSDEAKIAAFGQKLIQELGLQALLVTRSEKGMSLLSASEKHDIPTRAVAVYDITGAGDTVLAAFAVAIADGLNYLTAAQFANYAAGVVVAKVGTATTTLAEIAQVLDHA